MILPTIKILNNIDEAEKKLLKLKSSPMVDAMLQDVKTKRQTKTINK